MTLEQKKKLANIAHLIMRGLMLLAALGFALREEWLSALSTLFIFILLISPSLLKKRFKLYIPFELELAMSIFVILTLFVGSLLDFYLRFHWWDLALHFGSGFLLGLAAFTFIYLLNQENSKLNVSPGFVSFFSITFSVFLAVLWEVYEFAHDEIIGGSMTSTGLPDTMSDLIVNIIGASIVAGVAYVWMRKRKRIPLTPQRITA